MEVPPLRGDNSRVQRAFAGHLLRHRRDVHVGVVPVNYHIIVLTVLAAIFDPRAEIQVELALHLLAHALHRGYFERRVANRFSVAKNVKDIFPQLQNHICLVLSISEVN